MPFPFPGAFPGPEGGAELAPAIDMNFTQGAGFDPRFSFTRASGGTYFDATGTLQTAAANAPRIDYGTAPGGVTNLIPNSTMQGAAVGTPGTVPTGWFMDGSPIDGIQHAITAVGVENGIPYIEQRWWGTTTAAATRIVGLTAATGTIPAYVGQTFTGSVYAALTGGSLSGVTLRQAIYEHAANGGVVAASFIGGTIAPASASVSANRFAATYTTGNAAITSITPYVAISYASGAVIDVTFRIGAPQFEVGTTANPWVPTYGTPANSGASPLGLLLEEQRTNSVRNPRCEGAVAGSPGTLPTYWSIVDNGGLTHQVVGTGTETGIPYIDLRIYGTTTASSIGFLTIEQTAAAAVNQVWTGSLYARLVGGSLANLTLLNLQAEDHNSTGGNVGSSATSLLSLPAGLLRSNRYSVTRTASGTGTAYEYLVLVWGFNSGVAVDFTLRIGAPQLEMGNLYNGPTSIILPPSGSPGATTRAAEAGSMPSAGIYSPGGGSMVVEAIQTLTNGGNPGYWARFDNGFSWNTDFGIGSVVLGTAASADIRNAGTVSETWAWGGTPALGTPYKAGISASASGAFASAMGGTITSSNSTAVMPPASNITTFHAANGGVIGGSAVSPCGYLRRVRYWPRAMSTSELAYVTT